MSQFGAMLTPPPGGDERKVIRREKKKPEPPFTTIAVDMHFEVSIPVEDKVYWESASEAERREYLEARIDCSYCDAGVELVAKSIEGDKFNV